MRVSKTSEFVDWYESLAEKEQGRIRARLYRIAEYDHFGDIKYLGDSLSELRWAQGYRVYFTLTTDDDGNTILLLLGGLKNGQKKDIKKARLLIGKYASS